MAGKVTGDRPDTLIARLMQTQGAAVAAINSQMEIEMTAVRDDAVARAPVDDGYLEESIKLRNDGRRRSWSVYVDETTPAPEKTLPSGEVIETPGRVVGDYAVIRHEDQYNLGPLSIQKDAGRGIVGRKFLENAFGMRRDTMLRSLRAKLAWALSRRGY